MAQYNTGKDADTSSTNQNDGKKPDPFMMLVPPLGHYDNNVRFTTVRHFVTVGKVRKPVYVGAPIHIYYWFGVCRRPYAHILLVRCMSAPLCTYTTGSVYVGAPMHIYYWFGVCRRPHIHMLLVRCIRPDSTFMYLHYP